MKYIFKIVQFDHTLGHKTLGSSIDDREPDSESGLICVSVSSKMSLSFLYAPAFLP